MSLVTRTNRGRPTGLFVAEFGNWKLYQTADGRYKLTAKDPVNGKANYGFCITNGSFDVTNALDSYKLKADRPDLFKTVETYFRSQNPILVPEDVAVVEDPDPYGDLAISRKRRLTPDQNWKRGLLQMRRISMEHIAAKKASVWESAVRVLWAGVFKTRIGDAEAQRAVAYIESCVGEIDLAKLLKVEQDYYAGKFVPNHCQMLEAQLQTLAGEVGFQNEEVLGDGSIFGHDEGGGADRFLPLREDRGGESARAGEVAGQVEFAGGAIRPDLGAEAERRGSTAAGSNWLDTTAPVEELHEVRDPFSAFH